MLIKGTSALVTGAGSVRPPPPRSLDRSRARRSPLGGGTAARVVVVVAHLVPGLVVANDDPSRTRGLTPLPSPRPPTFPQGIGRGLSVRLAESGASGLTLVDVSRDALEATRSLALAANPSCRVVAVVADVANAPALEAAFATHARAHGGLHLCFNNAGVGERSDWRSVVDVNLNAVVHGTRLATALMARGGGGAVVNVASAGGVFAMPQAPVYSATKAAVVLFSKSLAHLAETKRVRVNALCPQFTDTALVGAQFDALGKEKAEALLAQTGGSLLRVDQVVDAAMELVRDDARAGEALAVMNARGGVAAYVPVPDPRRWRAIDVGNPPRSGPSSRRPPPAVPAPRLTWLA